VAVFTVFALALVFVVIGVAAVAGLLWLVQAHLRAPSTEPLEQE